MKKRIVAVFLTMVMSVSLMACGGKAVSDETSTETGGTSTDTTEVAKADTEEVNLYGFDEPVTVKLGVSYAFASDFKFFGDETETDNAWVDLYKENNIIPEILYGVDPSQEETKLSTAIMSGDYPDIIKSKVADYKNYAESGVIADITDVYEKYASDELKAYMNFDGGKALDSLKIDGKLYGLPIISNPYSGANMMFIRQDWLDNLGLSMPETMEDLQAVAHAFTYDDPDGNGKNDTYGLALDGIKVINTSVGNMDPFFNAFGVYLGKNGMSYVTDDSGNITWGGANVDGMKSALQLLQDMYKDGSLAKDFITMDDQSVFEEAGSGRAGIWFGPLWGGMNPAIDAAKNNVNAHIVAAEVPDGLNQGGTKAYTESTPSEVYCVSSQCENPELLIKLWNLSVKYQSPSYTTPEEYNMYFGDSANYTGWKTSIIYATDPGADDQTYAMLKDAFESGDTSKLSTKQLENYTSLKTYMDAVEAGTFDPEDATQQRGLSLYTVYGDPLCAREVLINMKSQDQYIFTAFSGIPTETVTNAIPTLQKLLVETIVKIVTGESVDSYDSFMDTWYAMGGQEAMDEANGN